MAAEKEIRERLLKQAIPSDYMRGFYCSIDRNFTDFELAAMLWNSRMKQTEKIQAIKELSEITADSELREQIEGRLRYEREAYHVFADNADGKYIYVVEDEEEQISGFFRKLDTAIAFAKKDGRQWCFSVSKQIVVEDELPMQKIGEWNPNLFPDKKNELSEYCAYPDGRVTYFANGEIRYQWSNCLPDEIKNLVDQWSTERFENYPLLLENPFDKGDIVMYENPFKKVDSVMYEDMIGVIDISKEDVESDQERIRNGDKKYCDYSDSTTTIVQYIRGDGRIFHSHSPLLSLKKVSREELPEEIREYVGMVSDMVRGKYALDAFLSKYEQMIRQTSGRVE